MKRLLFGIVALLVLLVAAVLIVPSFINWNTYKPEIVAQAREATGRELAIDGDIRLKLLPAPALSVEQVRVANIEGAPTPDMATLKALDVRVALLPLLSGEIQVESVRLVEPVVVLERLPDGRAGWDFGIDSDGSGDGPALRLDRFEVDNGTVTYRDLASGREVLVDAVSLAGSAASLAGPFEAKGEARVGALPISFEARSGAFEGGRPVPLLLLLGMPGEKGGLTLSGSLEGSGAATRFAGTLKASADAPAKLLAAAGYEVAVPPPLAGKLELDGKLEGTAEQIAANDLTLRIGETQATGAVSMALADQPSIDATVALNRIDLDAILAAAGGKDDAAAPGPAMPALPADLKASLNLSVDGVAFREGVLRQVRLAAGLDGGVVSIGQFGALLPGGSDLKLVGTVEQVENQPRFEGQVEMASDNLRGLLAWLDVDTARVPAGRLGAMALTSQLRATPQLVEVYGMNLRLDASTITGGVAFLIQDRPSFGIDLAIDRINVDGYLPTEAAGAERPAAASPLAVLDSFDTNFTLKVARLTYNRTPVDGIDIDMSLVGGRLDLRKATAANLAGASASLAASGSGFGDATPRFDADLRVLANDITGLARLLRLELPVPAERLGKADLRASLTGTAQKLDLDGTAVLGQVKLAAKGALTDALGSPRADLTLSFDHPSLAGLSKLVRLGVTPLKGNDSAVAVVAAVKGNADEVAVDGDLKAAGATLTAAGRFSALQATPQLDVAVNLVHGDLRGFMRGLGVDYDPALQQLGGLGMSARLRGDTDTMNISEFKGVFGPVQVAGTGALKLGGPRPYVSADLQANQIVADFFLAPSRPAGGGAARAQGGARAMPAAGRWSREPIDLSGLGAVDADIKLSAKQISFDRYDFDDPKLTLALREGVLDVKPLTGRLFDGAVSLTAKLGSRPRPALDLAIDLKGADMRKALVTATGRSDISGRLDLDGRFRTTGASPWALISGLAGQARIGGGDGAVDGIDMALLSQRLGRLNKLPDFLDLMNRVFSGGQTRLHTLAGNWVVQDGVARSNDTVAQLDASVANVVGVIDLPAWEMDIRSTLNLTEHPDAPAVGVDLFGPLDNPRRDVKTAALEAYVAKRVGETVLRKAIGDGKDGDKKLDRLLDKTLGKPKQDGGNNGQRDAVKGLLKGILKGQ
ncbi:MAG: AsmA family protein [Alphaproteobacteria bacterium]